MSRISIERTIYGSLVNSIGDDTISYSNGSSKEAEIFRTLLDSDANKKLASNYASLFLYWSPISRCHTFLHLQGNHVEFKADGRSFCTRGIYEISHKDMESIKYDYLSALDSIPRMSRMEKIEYGINPETEVNSVIYEENELDNNEKLLLGIVYSAILNNKKVFIKIKAIEDEYYENNVLNCNRLRAIMKIVSLLPSKIAQYASVAFSVDAVLNKMLDGFISPLIIAHHDAIFNWEVKDILIANWEGDELKIENAEIRDFSEDIRVVKEMARLPLLGTYMEQNQNKQLMPYCYVNIIRQHLDDVLDNRSNDNNDIILLNLAYLGCEDKTAYRHEAMAIKLYELIVKNNEAVKNPKETIAKIDKEYHLSQKRLDGSKYFEKQIEQATDIKDVEQLLGQIDCNVKIEKVVIRKICSEWNYIEDVINNIDKYDCISKICKESIHKKIVNEGLERMLMYFDNSYVCITIDEINKKIDSRQALFNACEIVGWGYATTFIENKVWRVSDITDFNKWYNQISPKIDFNKQPVVLKLFTDLLNSLMVNKTFSQCCDIVLQLDVNRVFDISSIKPKLIGENAQKKLKQIHDKRIDYYDSLQKEYERLTKPQIMSWSFVLSTFRNRNVTRTQLSDLTPKKIASIAIKEGANHKVLDLCKVISDSNSRSITNHLIRSAEIIALGHIEQMINNNNLVEELLINFEALPATQTIREYWQNCYLNAFKSSSRKDFIAETLSSSSGNASKEYSEFLFEIIESLKTDESIKPFYKKFLDRFIGETKSNKEGYRISDIRRYHLDNLLVAVLTGAIVFLCYPYIYPNHQTETKSNIGLDEDNKGINELVANTDTLYLDADLNQNKISRGLLLRLSESVIERIEKKYDVKSIHPVICLYGDSLYTIPLINTPVDDLMMIDSLLFGKSLVSTNRQEAVKDSVVVIENDEQKTKVLDGKNRLLSQLRQKSLTVNEVKIDSMSLLISNNLFKDKYDLEPSSRHLLYYLFVVKEMEQFKKNKAINHELSY